MGLRKIFMALAIPLLVGGAVRADDAARKGPPDQTPSGTKPALPGGGNEHASSDNAATPADPGRAPDTGDFNDSEAGSFTDSHAPDVKGEAGERWGQMSPEERNKACAGNPRLRNCARKRWQDMKPAERGAFIRSHPGLRERLRERWASIKDDDRGTFLRRHPAIRKRCGCGGGGPAMRKPGASPGPDNQGVRPQHEKGNNGVRDHGRGRGRDGVGQGAGNRRGGAGTHGGANRPGRGGGGRK
jgi:hypothetical protein